MNFRTSSPFVIILGCLIPTHARLFASEVPHHLTNSIASTPAASEEETLNLTRMHQANSSLLDESAESITLEAAEKWLFSYFRLQQQWQGLQKEIQWLVTRKLSDMVIGTFAIDKPVRSYRFLSSSERDPIVDGNVTALIFAHHKKDEEPTHICFCTSGRCRIIDVRLPESNPEAIKVIMASSLENQRFTNIALNEDNTKVLLTSKTENPCAYPPEEKPMILQVCPIDSGADLLAKQLLCPSRDNLSSKPWYRILDIAFLKNDTIVVVTASREVFCLDSAGNCLSYWQDIYNKDLIAHAARINVNSSEIYLFLAPINREVPYPFKLIRFNFDSQAAIPIIDSQCELHFRQLPFTFSQNGMIAFNDWLDSEKWDFKRVLLFNSNRGQRLSHIDVRRDNREEELSSDGRLLLFTPGEPHSQFKDYDPPFTSSIPVIVHCPSKRPLVVFERKSHECMHAFAKFDTDNSYVTTAFNSLIGYQVCLWKINPLVFTLDQNRFYEQLSLKNALIILIVRLYKKTPDRLAKESGLELTLLKNYMAILYKNVEEPVKTYIKMILRK